FLGVIHVADRANSELLAPAADDSAAGILDVLPDEIGQFAERHAYRFERFRLWLDDELALLAAALIDFRNARHDPQQGLDDVLLDFGQLEELFQFVGRFIGRTGA